MFTLRERKTMRRWKEVLWTGVECVLCWMLILEPYLHLCSDQLNRKIHCNIATKWWNKILSQIIIFNVRFVACPEDLTFCWSCCLDDANTALQYMFSGLYALLKITWGWNETHCNMLRHDDTLFYLWAVNWISYISLRTHVVWLMSE